MRHTVGRFPTVEHVHARQEFEHAQNFGRARYENGIRTANPLPARYLHVRGAVVDVDPLRDGLRTCACRLYNILRSVNTYFGAAIHIAERQYIFQSGNTYFRAAPCWTLFCL